MIDHVSIRVSDMGKSKKFYTAALSTVGYVLESEDSSYAGFRAVDGSSLWLVKEDYVTHGAHVAFPVASEEAVQNFYDTAIAAGGTDNGAPGPRPEYGDYYGGFVKDMDGNNIEAVKRSI